MSVNKNTIKTQDDPNDWWDMGEHLSDTVDDGDEKESYDVGKTNKFEDLQNFKGNLNIYCYILGLYDGTNQPEFKEEVFSIIFILLDVVHYRDLLKKLWDKKNYHILDMICKVIQEEELISEIFLPLLGEISDIEVEMPSLMEKIISGHICDCDYSVDTICLCCNDRDFEGDLKDSYDGDVKEFQMMSWVFNCCDNCKTIIITLLKKANEHKKDNLFFHLTENICDLCNNSKNLTARMMLKLIDDNSYDYLYQKRVFLNDLAESYNILILNLKK